MRSYTLFLLPITAVFIAGTAPDGYADPDRQINVRIEECIDNLASLELRQGVIPTWVDDRRWSIAHACLTKNTRLDEANRYFSELKTASSTHGLIHDSDVQVTDLLRTWMEFHDKKHLNDAAKANLKKIFAEWSVPNHDRNRDADKRYEWPCEYTENHSLNILAASYMINHLLDRDTTLSAKLLTNFLDDRAKWGWSEFNSPQYTMVNAKALSVIADFAPDNHLKTAATMHLDLLVFQFSAYSQGYWRAIPACRAGRHKGDPRRDSFLELARLWFGDPKPDSVYAPVGFIAHFLTSAYRPPDCAVKLNNNPALRGSYEATQLATTGPDKLRVPIVMWVTPFITLASAQGSGSYYDGLYGAASFSTSPDKSVVCDYGAGRNMFQFRNVLATFGEIIWNGDFEKFRTNNITIATDNNAFLGHIDLGDNCHLLVAGDINEFPDTASFLQSMSDLDAGFSNGIVSWRTSGGARISMSNKKSGERWKMLSAAVNGTPVRVDRNMLFDSPHIRSARDSRIVEIRFDGCKKTYDFTLPHNPEIRNATNPGFPVVPPDHSEGPFEIRFAYIPAGEFVMGSPLTEGRSNERPQRWIYLDEFMISETEITVGQYLNFLENSPDAERLPDWMLDDPTRTENHPVSWVSWNNATAFCEWLSIKTGEKYRLPTEAQWEKAAKGFSHRAYPWGADYDGSQAGNPNRVYLPVRAKPSDISPFGVFDMAGNVWEWCRDTYNRNAYASQELRNPYEQVSASANDVHKSLRGCGWNYDPDTFRTSYRSYADPELKSVHIGFRIVKEITDETN